MRYDSIVRFVAALGRQIVQLHRLNWDGLTVGEVIKQSIMCHQDWDTAFHRDYLLGETAFEGSDLGLDATGHPLAPASREEACKFPAGCHVSKMPGHELCLDHYVQVARLMEPAGGW